MTTPTPTPNAQLVLPDFAIESLTDNLPEASMGLSCVGWRYDERIFRFIDEEDGKRITTPKGDAT